MRLGEEAHNSETLWGEHPVDLAESCIQRTPEVDGVHSANSCKRSGLEGNGFDIAFAKLGPMSVCGCTIFAPGLSHYLRRAIKTGDESGVIDKKWKVGASAKAYFQYPVR